MKEKLFLSDVLKLMKRLDKQNNPIPFSIGVRTFSIQNKTGGNFKEYHNAKLMQAPKEKGAKRLADKTDFKDPNHWENRTRNIKTMEGIKKINILFIEEFNGCEVVL